MCHIGWDIQCFHEIFVMGTSVRGIHSLIAGDLRNSKGDGEITRGTPPVAIMPETAWPQRARPNHPTQTHLFGALATTQSCPIIRAQVGCQAIPAPQGGSTNGEMLIPTQQGCEVTACRAQAALLRMKGECKTVTGYSLLINYS